jgi:hypothetical protein
LLKKAAWLKKKESERAGLGKMILLEVPKLLEHHWMHIQGTTTKLPPEEGATCKLE